MYVRFGKGRSYFPSLADLDLPVNSAILQFAAYELSDHILPTIVAIVIHLLFKLEADIQTFGSASFFFLILLFIFHVQISLNSNSLSALKALLRQVGKQFHAQFTIKVMSI